MKTDKTPGHIKLDEKMEVSETVAGWNQKLRDTRKPVLFVVCESPDDMSDSDGGIRKRTRTLG